MKKNQVFKSKYLKAENLNGRTLTVAIESVRLEVLKNAGKEESKPVVYFVGAGAGLVLNVTNFQKICEITGKDDSDNWPGHNIELFPSTVEMNGTVKDCIRIRAPEQLELTPQPAVTPAAADGDMDDAIPF